MKQGMSIDVMAAEVMRQKTVKRDYLAPTTSLLMEVIDNTAKLRIGSDDDLIRSTMDIRPLAHSQIASRVGIPSSYYHRMVDEAPNLLAANVNHWFSRVPEQRMIRTMDNAVRAFLSGRYRPLDNAELLTAVIPTLEEMKCRIQSCDLTENRLYLKATTDRLTVDIKPGDTVQAGIVISNSEVGGGTVLVEPMIYRLVCANGMIAEDRKMRKYHIGRNVDNREGAEELFSSETKQLDDRAFWMKTRDVVRGSFTKDIFEATTRKLIKATQQEIQDPVKVVEVTAEKYGMTDEEQNLVLNSLINGKDLSRYGLLNAVTAASQQVGTYERATEMERIGGQILELAVGEWDSLNLRAQSAARGN